jgi:hypothetical protein
MIDLEFRNQVTQLTDAIVDKKLSRRQFVGAAAGGAAALGAGAILAPSLTAAAATPPSSARASGVTGAIATPLQGAPATAQTSGIPATWDYQADVVVIGSGAAGLVAAISAFQGGSSVLVVEVNYDVGGHGICAGGHMDQMGPADQVYASLTASTNLYQDRALSKTFANNMFRLYNWLKTNGVVLSSSGSTYIPATTFPTSNISLYAYYEGVVGNGIDAFECSTESPAGKGATAIYRPLELTARNLGVQFLLNWRMTGIIREQPYAGNVLGITAQGTGGRFMPGSTAPLQSWRSEGNVNLQLSTANIRANQAVIICDGGHSSNPARRMEFDFRQTGLYRAAGEPYSYQNGDGEYAARRVGAALWATGNETDGVASAITVPGRIGTEYGYTNTDWHPGSPVFPLVRANGLVISNFADVIDVNMAGVRFVAENASGYTWVNAAMSQNAASAAPDYAAGPIWAIFDSAGVAREKWTLGYPYTDPLFFFQANDLPTLAQEINSNVYQVTPMDGTVLQATVTRYNSMVAAGKGDTDFGKTTFNQQINTPPYYAAWYAPSIHDCLTGIRMNSDAQVIDLDGNVIPRLYVAGESAGGFSTHGLSKCMVFGLIAGTNAAQEPTL